MMWLSPWLLLGLLGLGLPIWAHLLGRAKPRVLAFPALRFAQVTPPPRTKRRQIRDPWLLILRLAVLAGLVLAIAQPMCATANANGEMLSQAHDAIVLVDRSASTQQQSSRGPLADLLVQDASNLVAALAPNSRVALISSAVHEPVLPLSEDRERVNRRLLQWRQELATTPLTSSTPLGQRGWAKAAEMAVAARASGRAYAIYVLSDPTAEGLGSLTEAAQAGLVTIIRSPTTERQSATNLAIVDVKTQPQLELGADNVQVQVRVQAWPEANPDPALLAAAHLCLRVGDAPPTTAKIDFRGQSSGIVDFSPSLADAQAAVAAQAYLCRAGGEAWHDALDVDNGRALWVQGRTPLRLALINGSPSEVRGQDEVYFIGQSLRAALPERDLEIHGMAGQTLVERLLAQGSAALDNFDVVVLANVPALPAAATDALLQRLQRGFGLWITAGDQVDPTAYNATMRPLLPTTLREAVFVSTPGREQGAALGMSQPQADHPWLRSQSDLFALGSSQTKRLVLLDPELDPQAKIAWNFDNGAPAIVTRRIGRGFVALLTTTLDLDWSDLALRPGFVGLSASLVQWLASGATHSSAFAIEAGMPVTLPAGMPLTIVSPSGRTSPYLGGDTPGVWRETHELGHYKGESATPRTAPTTDAPAPGFAPMSTFVRFSTHLAAHESNLNWVDAPDLSAAHDNEHARGSARPLWRTVGWIVFVLLMAESIGRMLRLSRDQRPHVAE